MLRDGIARTWVTAASGLGELAASQLQDFKQSHEVALAFQEALKNMNVVEMFEARSFRGLLGGADRL